MALGSGAESLLPIFFPFFSSSFAILYILMALETTLALVARTWADWDRLLIPNPDDMLVLNPRNETACSS